MDLRCYIYPGWEPRFRAAPRKRDWMDEAPEKFPYRCLPLAIANSHGWEVLTPCGFEAEWNGGPAPGDVVIRPDPGTEPHRLPVPLFGLGTMTFHIEGLIRTPPGYGIWVSGSPNSAKDGIAPLAGLIETDWSPYSFTMNWRFTRPHHPIRFEENEPFAFIFPVERKAVEEMEPRFLPIDDDPELKQRFEQWSHSRDSFQAKVAANPPKDPSDKWQKFYYRGVYASGEPGPEDHRAKLRVAEFAGGKQWPEAVARACPVAHAPRPAAPAPDPEAMPPGKLVWQTATLETLRNLSNDSRIERRAGMSREEFLNHYYAANRPVILTGEMADWPALTRWTPEYLREKIGDLEVEIQTGRANDPDFERNMAHHKQRMPCADFLTRIAQPDNPGNDCYMTAYNAAQNPEVMARLTPDLGFIDKVLDPKAENPHGLIWIGPGGTFTPLHHDLTNNLLIQIQGRKQLLLVSPGETPRMANEYHVYSRIRDLRQPDLVRDYPKLEGLRVHQLVLEPGEALFLPICWWHQVEALDFSVSFTHVNFLWPNAFYESYPFPK